MKFDIREIQALKKSGAKYNQYDEAVSRYLLALKIEGYDTSNIKNYEQLLELMNDYNVVLDKNLDNLIADDINNSIREGVSINKELLDEILNKYEKYLATKQGKEKLKEDVYHNYKVWIANKKKNDFLENIKDLKLQEDSSDVIEKAVDEKIVNYEYKSPYKRKDLVFKKIRELNEKREENIKNEILKIKKNEEKITKIEQLAKRIIEKKNILEEKEKKLIFEEIKKNVLTEKEEVVVFSNEFKKIVGIKDKNVLDNEAKEVVESINRVLREEHRSNNSYKVKNDELFHEKVWQEIKINNPNFNPDWEKNDIKEFKSSIQEFVSEKIIRVNAPEKNLTIKTKEILLKTDFFIEKNPEEINLLRRENLKQRLSDGFMGANEGFNMEQEIAFRKYRNFLANTFYPEDGFFESIGTKDWLSGYKEIKGDLIKSGLKLPYEMKEVADADNWARAFENPAILHQAVREQKTAQFWNNFNERTGGAFKNFGSNFQSGFNSFATQTRNGIGGAFNQFFGRKEGGGASPFMSGLKNIGNTLGQGAQNGARNALQGLNNGIGSMMKGLGGKLGGFGAKGGGMAAKGGLVAAKGLGALFAGGGGGIAIAVILIIILFVFILIYSGSLNQNLSSSLLPGAYGYQESDEDDEGGGGIVDGVCFVTRNGIKMPIFEPTTGGGRISTDTDGKRYDLAKKYPDFVGTTPSQYCYALENKFDSRVLPLLIKMIDDAKKDGIILGIDSMYRSYERQQVLYNAYVEYLSTGFCPSSECSCTCEPADPPGSSAHHTGRALDFNWWWTDGGSRYDWIKNNGYKYGFYQTTSEPWHWEYNPKLEAGESCEVETN